MKMPNQALIYEALCNAYPDDAAILIRLCTHGLEQPLGIEHPFIIQDLIGNKLADKDFEKIQLAYVLITAYYFLLDAVVDEHLEEKLQSLYLTHLLALSCQKIDEVVYSNPRIDRYKFFQTFSQLISQNAKAIVLENKFRSNPFSYSEQEEFESIVGRSNSSILLLEIIAMLTDTKNLDDLKEILRDFAFYVQLSDDLADWRDDLKVENYTSFLRELFSKHKRILSEDELEEEIYLSTIFEARALKVIKGLEKVAVCVREKGEGKGLHLKLLVEQHIEKIKELMTQIIAIKIQAQNV